MIKTLSLACFSIFTLMPSLAQDRDQTQELLEKALVISIDSKIVSAESKVTWSFQAVKLTIPGKSVTIQLNGTNIKVGMTFTPYETETEGRIILVVQSQIMLQDPGTGTAKYSGNMKQIPISLGEKIQFYPLGVNESTSVNIVLEIQVVRYKDAVAGQNQPLSDPDSLKEKSGEGNK